MEILKGYTIRLLPDSSIRIWQLDPIFDISDDYILAHRHYAKLAGECWSPVSKYENYYSEKNTILNIIINKVDFNYDKNNYRNNLILPRVYYTIFPIGWKINPNYTNFHIPSKYQDTRLRIYTTDKSNNGIAHARSFWKNNNNSWLKKLKASCSISFWDDEN